VLDLAVGPASYDETDLQPALGLAEADEHVVAYL
jgi:hypothetical protein